MTVPIGPGAWVVSPKLRNLFGQSAPSTSITVLMPDWQVGLKNFRDNKMGQ